MRGLRTFISVDLCITATTVPVYLLLLNHANQPYANLFRTWKIPPPPALFLYRGKSEGSTSEEAGEESIPSEETTDYFPYPSMAGSGSTIY